MTLKSADPYIMKVLKPGHKCGCVGPEYNIVPESAPLRFHMRRTTFPRRTADAHSTNDPEGSVQKNDMGCFTFIMVARSSGRGENWMGSKA